MTDPFKERAPAKKEMSQPRGLQWEANAIDPQWASRIAQPPPGKEKEK